MRIIYALIVFFLLMCVFFTRWYLCEVRGLCETAAVLEVFAMILAAFLIGFAGSWLISENIFRSVRQQVGGLLKEKTGMQEQLNLLERENQSTRRHLSEWQQEAALLAQGRKMDEPIMMQVKTQVYSLKQELEQYQRRYENLKQETDALRDSSSQLKSQLLEEQLRMEKLRNNQIERQLRTDPVSNPKEIEKTDPFRSRFTPSSRQTRDNLTLISGIGPAIQRKLNELGIYSFLQLSQLTPEMVDQISRSIKFFPDRIGRDNWIGQAAALNKQRR